MEKKIYLPSYAKRQLESSDNSRVWAKPIPYRDKPEPGFTSETILREKTLELGAEYVLEGGKYRPDRDQYLDGTVECLQEVKLPKSKKMKTDKKVGTKEKPYEAAKNLDGNPVRHIMNPRYQFTPTLYTRHKAYLIVGDDGKGKAVLNHFGENVKAHEDAIRWYEESNTRVLRVYTDAGILSLPKLKDQFNNKPIDKVVKELDIELLIRF